MNDTYEAGFRQEDFECAPSLRLSAHERLMKVKLDAFNARFDRIERMMEGLERRLWLIASGVVGIVLSQALVQMWPQLP